MKGKQLEFREPQIQTAEAEVPSVLLVQNKRTQHNTLQHPAWRGLPGKTPLGLMFPLGSASQGLLLCSLVSFPSHAQEGCRDHPETPLSLPVLGDRKRTRC